MADAEAFVDLVNRRAGLLAALAEEPRSRHVLVDAVADSKTTVYKGVAQLLEADLLEERDGALHPTLAGRATLARYRTLADAAALAPLLADVPSDALAPAMLEGADAVTPDSGSFDRHLAYGERVLRDATRVEGLVCAVSEDTLEIFRERVIAVGVPASLVVATDVAEALADRDGLLDDLVDLPHLDLYRAADPLPIGLLVVTTGAEVRAAVEVYRDEAPIGLLVNDEPEAVEWARSAVEARRSAAEPL